MKLKKIITGIFILSSISFAKTYTVEPGDSLFSISKNYGIELNKLKALNELKSDLIIPGQKLEIDENYDEYYIVQSGDSLISIAIKHNMSLEEIKSLNNLKGDFIKTGKKLKIKKENIHIVNSGETLTYIAKEYNTSVKNLLEINNLKDSTIYAGQELKIEKDNEESTTKKTPAVTGSIAATEDLNFIWPTEWKGTTSNWGYRTDPVTGKQEVKHEGIDLKASLNTPVYAPEKGIVRIAGWFKGYGKTVVIDHGNGYSTRFGHLNFISLKPGDTIKKGELIGKSGNTGKSTGPHLHYEIRLNEEPLNPLDYRKNNIS